jgi:hypothetical protein
MGGPARAAPRQLTTRLGEPAVEAAGGSSGLALHCLSNMVAETAWEEIN